MTAPSDALRSAYRAILQFLAGSVIVTDGEARHNGAPPLCTMEETKFLARIVRLTGAHRQLDPIDRQRLYMLFCRSSSSRYLDPRNARYLYDSLLLLAAVICETSE